MNFVRILRRTQFLLVALSESLAFFSNPMNLAEITPKEMGFEVLSAPPKAIAGSLATARPPSCRAAAGLGGL